MPGQCKMVQTPGLSRQTITLMSKQPIVEPASQVNERRWQTWVVKNRELDRRSAARRLRLLKVVVAVILVGVALHRYLG